MGSSFLMVALGCGQCREALAIASQQSFVVFGTMHGEVFRRLAQEGIPGPENVFPLYFYETG